MLTGCTSCKKRSSHDEADLGCQGAMLASTVASTVIAADGLKTCEAVVLDLVGAD